MLVNEVCKKCFLTKKAIEYYVEQGLVSPKYKKMVIVCFQKKM